MQTKLNEPEGQKISDLLLETNWIGRGSKTLGKHLLQVPTPAKISAAQSPQRIALLRQRALKIFNFIFFTSIATYQSSEKKMILHQTLKRKPMFAALTFIKLTFMKILQLQSILRTLNPETPVGNHLAYH